MSDTPSDADSSVSLDAAFAALSPAQQEMYLLRLRDVVESMLVARVKRVVTAQESAFQRLPRGYPQISLS